MRQRSGSILNHLALATWPIGGTTAALILLAGYGVLPNYLSHQPYPILAAFGRELAKGSFDPLIWLLAALGWIAAARPVAHLIRRRRLLDAQTSLASLRAMSWRDFERLVAEAYARLGYRVEEAGQGGADGGIDLVLRRDGRVTLVQCKRWRTQSVGVAIVREQFGLLIHHGANAAIVVTTGDFTPEARAFAAGKPMELVDGMRLLELVRSVRQVDRSDDAEPQPLASDSTTTNSVERTQAISCPKCGAAMVERRAKQTGAKFLGCSRYPACRGTRDMSA